MGTSELDRRTHCLNGQNADLRLSLLNLGPTRTGRIIKPMVDRVLEVGRWLKHSGDCVYGTVCPAVVLV